MCGIAGFSGSFDRELLVRMRDALAHRGPDGKGELMIGGGDGAPIGLAHRRLSIIDLSARGRQPMTVDCDCCGVGQGSSPETSLWLTYNGELYNYRELRNELQARGHRFHSETDSEVLLHLYGEEGPRMLRRLNGIFAFALYDGRQRGQRDGMRSRDLLVARDGLGVKPLYYTALPEGVLFASELKALLESPLVSRGLDPVAVHNLLAYLWSPAPATVLRAVRKLPPGGAMVLRDARVALEWSHYDVPFGTAPLLDTDRESAAVELRARLRTAVERQLVADVPVGAFLSGGVDSSGVVAMMRELQPGVRPRCYSIGFAGDGDVEGNPADLPYARRVADRLDVDLQVLEIGPDAIQHLERMLFFLDEPQADPAPINALLISEQARRDGIPVLLSGAGGDDLFSGYRRHYALSLERYWGWLPAAVRGGFAAAARGMAHGGWGGAMRYPAARRISKAFLYADEPADRRIVSYFWWSDEILRRTLYTPALSAELEGVDTAAPLLDSLGRLPAGCDPLQRMLHLEIRHFLADHNLNYTDKMGMAAGVEVRVPFLDRDLVEFAARVPSAFKQDGRIGKAVLKRALTPTLPNDVLYRSKSGFGAPLRRWLRTELRDQVADTLSARSLRERGLFEPAAVHRLVSLDRAGAVDASYTIFALMCLEIWCRTFVDGPTPAPLNGKNGKSSAEFSPLGALC